MKISPKIEDSFYTIMYLYNYSIEIVGHSMEVQGINYILRVFM
jgi:hypothetical protein